MASTVNSLSVEALVQFLRKKELEDGILEGLKGMFFNFLFVLVVI